MYIVSYIKMFFYLIKMICIAFITLQFLPKITGQFYLLAKAKSYWHLVSVDFRP